LMDPYNKWKRRLPCSALWKWHRIIQKSGYCSPKRVNPASLSFILDYFAFFKSQGTRTRYAAAVFPVYCALWLSLFVSSTMHIV
jgi:hypothetical protein